MGRHRMNDCDCEIIFRATGKHVVTKVCEAHVAEILAEFLKAQSEVDWIAKYAGQPTTLEKYLEKAREQEKVKQAYREAMCFWCLKPVGPGGFHEDCLIHAEKERLRECGRCGQPTPHLSPCVE